MSALSSTNKIRGFGLPSPATDEVPFCVEADACDTLVPEDGSESHRRASSTKAPALDTLDELSGWSDCLAAKRRGIDTVNTLPSPTRLSTLIVPSWSFTSSSTSARDRKSV